MRKHKNVVVLFVPCSEPHGLLNDLPYALLYLERALRDLGLEIILLDESRQPDYAAALEEKRERILLAGVSAMTGHQIHGGIAFSKRIRKICDASIVWGGWHASLLPEETLREPYIDFAVIGQGERPLRQLVERLLANQDVSDIRGLAFKRGAQVVVNRREAAENFNSFPSVNWNLVDFDEYVYSWLPHARRAIGYFTSHGCPFNCAFCSVAQSYGRRWYHKSVTQVIEELQFLKQSARIDGVSFEDDNFFVNADFCRELASAMIEAKLNLKWKCGAHPRLMTENFTGADLELFARSGCWRIYIGAESGDQTVLDIIDKKARVEHTFRFVEMLKPTEIIPRLSTMVCLPMDPARDFDLTVDMIGRAKLIDPRLQARVWSYTPYPGTALYDRARQKGFVPPQTLEGWANHTLLEFKAPWAPQGHERRLKAFTECYFPMLDLQAHSQSLSPPIRALTSPISELLFSIARWRVENSRYGFPLEPSIYFGFQGLCSRSRKALKSRLPARWIDFLRARGSGAALPV